MKKKQLKEALDEAVVVIIQTHKRQLCRSEWIDTISAKLPLRERQVEKLLDRVFSTHPELDQFVLFNYSPVSGDCGYDNENVPSDVTLTTK